MIGRWFRCRHRDMLRTTVDGRLIGYTCGDCDHFAPLDVSEPEKWARTVARREASERHREADARYRDWQRAQAAETVVPMRRRR